MIIPDGKDDAGEDRLHFKRGLRVPAILQIETSECGLVCLAMIAAANGLDVEMRELRRRFSISLRGATLDRLIVFAESLGLTGRPVGLKLHELDALQKPCMLHWSFNHFVVLLGVEKNGIKINDPAVGRRTVSWSEVDKHFTGVACEFTPNADFRRSKPATPVALRTLAGSIKGLGKALVQIFALALALEIFSLATPQFIQITIDQVLADGDSDLLTVLGLSYIGLLGLQTVITAMRSWTVTYVGTKFNLGWSANVFSHLLRLPQSYFLKRHLGDVISRFSAITSIQQTVTTQFVSAVLDGVMALLTLFVLLAYSPYLSSILVMILVVYGLIRLIYFQVFREANIGQVVATAKQQSCFVESVRGVQTLRLANHVPRQVGRYLNATASVLNKGVQVQRLSIGFEALSGLVTGGQRIVVLWLGAYMGLKGEFSAGMLTAFAAYADQFATKGANLIDYFIQLRLLRIQGERLADIMLTPVEEHVSEAYVGTVPEPSVRFEDVGFRYGDSEPWILRKVSFDIRAGEIVAITGASGAGKSTLVRLMLGLLEPTEGRIFIGGVDLAHLGKSRYREMLGTVLQDDTLFAGSIADNISLFAEDALIDNIEKAARLAQLHDDIMAMPMGYHSLVGDMGSSLSGGQQQRLYLARALYRNPKILVLDEATCHIDIDRERAINELLLNMRHTRILVAHRPETRGIADRELCVSGGGVVEAVSV